MKLKYYLRGLSIGIIFTAIIMGIALSGGKKEKMTNDEIIERARLLGMVMEDEVTKKSEDEKISETEKQEEDSVQNQAPVANAEEPVAKDLETKNPPVEDDTKPEVVSIEIKEGEYSDAVSRKLFDAGLISDASAFNRYLTETGADLNLRMGVHKIPKGVSQDEIIAILAQKPN